MLPPPRTAPLASAGPGGQQPTSQRGRGAAQPAANSSVHSRVRNKGCNLVKNSSLANVFTAFKRDFNPSAYLKETLSYVGWNYHALYECVHTHKSTAPDPRPRRPGDHSRTESKNVSQKGCRNKNFTNKLPRTTLGTGLARTGTNTETQASLFAVSQ